jgi:YD repeat-containing protein
MLRVGPIAFAVLLGCGSKTQATVGGQEPATRVSAERQEICPAALSLNGYQIDFFRHELAPGCPPAPFVSSEPVCGSSGECPHPCADVMAIGGEIRSAYTYDDAGNITAGGGGRYSYRCTYTNRRLVECTSNLNGRVEVARDPEGRIVSATDPKLTWTFSYNEHGDLATVVIPDMTYTKGATWTLEYDAKRRLISESTPLITVQYKYDAQGHMVERTRDAQKGAEYVPARTTFTYDGAGRLLGESSADGFQTTYTYDARGRLVEHSSVHPMNESPNVVRLEYDCPR